MIWQTCMRMTQTSMLKMKSFVTVTTMTKIDSNQQQCNNSENDMISNELNIRKGNMFSVYRTQGSLWCFTANSVIKNNGCLVMGAGIAKTAAEMQPALPGYFGTKIQNLSDFGLCVHVPSGIAAFQTKRDWKNGSDLELIKMSAQRLMEYLDTNQDGFKKADLAFPGIGHGGLDKADVAAVLEPILDQRVTLWTLR